MRKESMRSKITGYLSVRMSKLKYMPAATQPQSIKSLTVLQSSAGHILPQPTVGSTDASPLIIFLAAIPKPPERVLMA